jgi:membrane-bound lytic murein transglycosylase D
MICPSHLLSKHDSDQCPAEGQRPILRLTGICLLSLGTLLGGCVWNPDDADIAVVRPDQSGSTAGAPSSPTPAAGTQTVNTPAPEQTVEPDHAPPPVDLWARLRADFRLQDIDHQRIDREIQRLRRHPRSLQRMLARALPYLHHITGQVEQRGLPGELALLPAIESGFQPYAYSSNGATGLWQFMPATGRMLGLKQSRRYDGRRDIVRATDAALDYLQQLHRRLDDNWLYALAAYNCGIGTVQHAIRKARQRQQDSSYWALDLPGETDDYIPRLFALARIVADPGAYRVALPEIPNQVFFEQVSLKGPLDLEVAAGLAGVSLDELLQLNPAFRQGIVPPGRNKLLLPVGHAETFEAALAHLPSGKRLRWAEHRVRKGEALLSIAHRYHVSVAAIREANGLRGNLIRVGKHLRIPLSGHASDAARHVARIRSRVHYRVRKGDSLYTIARRFSVSIADLRRWNRLGRYLHPGQRLTVYIREAG